MRGEKMKAYVGTFMKKSGEVRTMTFMKVDDVPEGILPEAKGGKRPKLQEGMELVWDVENSAYRMFNHKTVVGNIEVVEVNLTQTQKQGV
tara:strand:- start:283 stop:552 length:270 start_codon:yes stop_codon:yes gene_type:complete